MPIYAYRCETCGFAKDVLQKMSDAPLTQCPECGKDAFRKQVTAAGFQLKGSGWYVTDFRGGAGASNGNGAKPATGDSNAAEPAKADSGKSDAASSDSGAGTAAAAPAAPATAPASNSGANSA